MGHARYFIVFFFLFFCVVLFAPTRARVAPAPILLTKANSTRAVAVESVTRTAEPFAPNAILPLGSDNRTRVMLFANNVSLLTGETAADVTASAEDVNHTQYPLAVEYVGNVAGASGVTAIVMRLHDNLGDVGDVLVGITLRGAIRFTAQITRRAYVHPARHWASTNTSVDRPPMGMRVRLKASVNISGYSPGMQVILRALKKYGMILADNGSNWFISGAPDMRWDDDELNTLKGIKGSDFEVIKMTNFVTP